MTRWNRYRCRYINEATKATRSYTIVAATKADADLESLRRLRADVGDDTRAWWAYGAERAEVRS